MFINMTNSEVVISVECPECHKVFLPYEAPLGRLPTHIPAGDVDRTLDCGKSRQTGIEIFAVKPLVRELTLDIIATAIY